MRSTARMRLLFLLLAVLPLSVPAHAAPMTLEAMTSTIWLKEQSSFSGIGLRLKIQPPQLVEGLTLVPLVEYWRVKGKLRTFDVDFSRKDATMGGFLRYDFKREGWHPYGGLGIAAHFISDEVDAPTVPLQGSDSMIKGGFLMVGGIGFGIAGNLGNLIEAEYHFLSEQSQLKLNWGLTWQFGAAAATGP